MPVWTDSTTRLRLPRPLGNQAMNRAAFIEFFNDLDSKAAGVSIANTFTQAQAFNAAATFNAGATVTGALTNVGSFSGTSASFSGSVTSAGTVSNGAIYAEQSNAYCEWADAGGGSSGAFVARRARGAISSPAAVGVGDTVGVFAFGAFNGGLYNFAAEIAAFVDGTPGATWTPARIAVMTSDGASAPQARTVWDRNGLMTVNNGAVVNNGAIVNVSLTGSAVGGGATQVAPGNHTHGAVPITRQIDIEADSFQPLDVAPAILVPVSAGSNKFEIQMPDGALRAAVRSIFMPTSYSGGPIVVRMEWYTSLASQSMYFELIAASTGVGGSVDPALGAVASVNAVSNASGGTYQETVINWTASLPAAGRTLEIGFQRFPSNGFDTSSDTARIRRLILEFT
jgi:hypothetical protein